MPILLAIETSTELASVALMQDESIIASEVQGVQTHSQHVLPMVQRLLAEAGLSLGRCDGIAFGSGPGSFTGVRTACGLAQGLAFGIDLPVFPVVTLLAMAERARSEHGANRVIPVLDARMGEVYAARYEWRGGWIEQQAPALLTAESLEAVDAELAVGNGLTSYANQLPASIRVLSQQAECMPNARWVAALARLDLDAGLGLAARDAQPLYLRNKVALTVAERQARISA